MSERVNFNPFTGNNLTTEQIQQLDTNKDGTVSDSELKAQWSWLSSQSKDDESDVSLKSANNYNVGEKAENETQLRQYLATVSDEYLESYLTQNPGLTDSERAAIQSLIKSASNTFLTEYLMENNSGPWDMKEVISALESKLEADISNNHSALETINASLNGYKENTDSNMESLISLTTTANSNNNISNSEWNQIKNKAIQYLMGMMLNGETNTELLSNLNPNYAKDSNYKNALSSINNLKDATDPVEIQRLLTAAQTSIANFLASSGPSKTVSAIDGYTQSQMEEALTTSLQSIADKYIESAITADMTDDAKNQIKAIVDNCITKFSAKIAETDSIPSYTEADLAAQFTDFINQQILALTNAVIQTKAAGSNIETSYDALLAVSDSANANGNISADEKSAIVEASVNFVMNQLLSGMEDIALLNGLNSNYKNTSDYKTLLNLISKIDGAIDADKLKEYQDEANALLKKMLDSYSGEELVNGVNSIRPMEVSEKSKDKIIFNSSISSDYQANASRSTSRGKQNEGRLEEIQAMAKADLEAIAESLKAQLKSELGSAYNESDAQRYINDAMNDTIAMFTANVSRRNGHGNYNTASDEQAFVFLRRSGTHKGRYTYNVQALVNTFIDNFNKTSKEKNKSKIDPSQATYDRENVLMDSLGNDYYRNKTEVIKGKNSDKDCYAQLIEKAKAQLQTVAASLKASLLSEGVPVSMSVIDDIIDECINATIEDMKSAFQYCQPSGRNSGGSLVARGAIATGIYGTTIAAGAGIGAAAASVEAAALAALPGLTADAAIASIVSGSALASGASASSAVVVASEAAAAAVASTTSTAASASAIAANAIPVAGTAAAVLALSYIGLKSFTNMFGATYGKHDASAGFFFERKSNSKSGNWGYDTQTLTNIFLNKFDEKLEEAKKNKKDNKVDETTTTTTDS